MARENDMNTADTKDADDFWQVLENELLEVSGEIRSLQEKTRGMATRRPWYRRIFG